jgi:hypothetical protein
MANYLSEMLARSSLESGSKNEAYIHDIPEQLIYENRLFH